MSSTVPQNSCCLWSLSVFICALLERSREVTSISPSYHMLNIDTLCNTQLLRGWERDCPYHLARQAARLECDRPLTSLHGSTTNDCSGHKITFNGVYAFTEPWRYAKNKTCMHDCLRFSFSLERVTLLDECVFCGALTDHFVQASCLEQGSVCKKHHVYCVHKLIGRLFVDTTAKTQRELIHADIQ